MFLVVFIVVVVILMVTDRGIFIIYEESRDGPCDVAWKARIKGEVKDKEEDDNGEDGFQFH